MRKTLVLSLVLILAVAANVFAGAEARMSGKIIDGATNKPVGNAVVKLEAVEGKTVKQEAKSKADGSYALFVLDGTIRYKLTVAAEGYATREEVLKLKLAETMIKDIYLGSGAAAAAADAQAAPAKVDPAVLAYNEGAALSNADDLAGAMAKFEEAVAAKPDLMAGWIALAKTAVKLKNYPKAIESANKVLELDNTDAEMWNVLYQSYVATGDKAKAAEAEKKLPKNAGSLFNEAARKINAGDDAAAEKLLQQAIETDPSFAIAYYELGMVYVRGGKSPEAKAALGKYLELDPNGKDAATAKEMMKYLK